MSRLQALRSLNIADNSLYYFPNAVTQLTNLTELILSGNRISCIPAQICELVKYVKAVLLSLGETEWKWGYELYVLKTASSVEEVGSDWRN